MSALPPVMITALVPWQQPDAAGGSSADGRSSQGGVLHVCVGDPYIDVAPIESSLLHGIDGAAPSNECCRQSAGRVCSHGSRAHEPGCAAATQKDSFNFSFMQS
jgi:hypothetical protein